LNYNTNNQTLTNHPGSQNGAATGGYLDVFNDIERVYCNVTTCNLYEVGCTTLLAANNTNYLHMNTVKPWNLTVNAAVEDGVTVKYCFKCTGDLAIAATPTAYFDNVQVRLIRNCKTHIQLVTNPLSGIVAPIRANVNSVDITMSSFFNFIDEYDCGTVTCGLYENDCTTLFTSRNVSMSPTWPDYAITPLYNVYLGYNYTTCIKCASVS